MVHSLDFEIRALAVTLALGIVAALCYLPSIRDHRAGRERSRMTDGLLLLGALLASAGLGYAEHSFHLMGEAWTWHFLLLAVFHGTTAYLLGSRLILSVALTCFAAWMGGNTTFSFFFPFSRIHLQGTGWRSLGCAATVLAFRALQGPLLPRFRGFIGVLEGFAVHLAGVGAVLLTLPGYFDRPMPLAAFAEGIMTLALVVLLIAGIGWQRRQQRVVLAAIAYAVIGFWRLEFQFIEAALPLAGVSLVTLVAAGVLLSRVRRHLKDR